MGGCGPKYGCRVIHVTQWQSFDWMHQCQLLPWGHLYLEREQKIYLHSAS